MSNANTTSSSNKALLAAFVVAVVLPCICGFCLLLLGGIAASILPIEEILYSPYFYY